MADVVETKQKEAKRISVLLAASFGLTVASFLVARAVSERQANGIGEAATTISEASLPSNDRLAPVRSELRRIENILEDVEDGSVGADHARLRASFGDARKTIDESWSAYLSLPIFPGERELQDAAEKDMRDMDAAMARVTERLASDDRSGAVVEARQMRPAVTRVDGDVQAIATMNRRIALDAAERIAELRKASHVWGVALDALSALLALVSAYFVIRVLRRLSIQAAERAAELEHFAGRVAHDIRSPLSTVSLALDLAARRSTDPEVASILARGIRTIRRTGQLVDSLLVFAAAGKPFAGGRGANVREIVEGVVEDVRASADAKHIAIDFELPETRVLAACSPGVLVSLTSNLVVNAIKYMGDAPIRRITVRARRSADLVRVEVVDTGPGVPPSLRTTIFDPHVRGEGTTASGFGLGLATVRRLAEAHGGSVGVGNADVGSLFWFELPIWKDEPQQRGVGPALVPRTT